MLKLAVFDLDGTLVNTIADLAYSCNSALKKYGSPVHSVESYRYFVGNGVYKLVERAVPENKRSPETLALVKSEFDRVYNENYLRESKPYDGIKEQLKLFFDNGVKLAVLSNKPDVFTKRMIAELFSDISFECVFGQRDSVPAKPNPDAVFEVMKICGVLPEETCFIGDSNVDIITGKNAGAVPVGVLWGFRNKAELSDSGAQVIADVPENLYKRCLSHFSEE